MPIPLEVDTARRVLQGPLKFGDPVVIEAIESLQYYEELECGMCDGDGEAPAGQIIRPSEYSSFRAGRCRQCGGTGKVWVYAEPE